MRIPHFDRDAKVIDVFDDILLPLPRRPAPSLCSVKFHDHNLRQAFVPHAQYVSRKRKSSLLDGRLDPLAPIPLPGGLGRHSMIFRAPLIVNAETSQ